MNAYGMAVLWRFRLPVSTTKWTEERPCIGNPETAYWNRDVAYAVVHPQTGEVLETNFTLRDYASAIKAGVWPVKPNE